MADKTVVSISIDTKLLAQLTDLADIAKRSRSAYIEQVLREHTEEQVESIRAFQHPVLGPALFQAFGSRDVLKAMSEVIGKQLDDNQLLLFRKTMESLTSGNRKQRRAAVNKVRKKR